MTKDIFQIIKKSKADYIQVILNDSFSSSIISENQEVKRISKISSSSATVYAWVGKKFGSISSNSFSEDLVKRAINIAKISNELDFFYGLPYEKKKINVNGLFYKEKSETDLLKISESMKVDLLKNEQIPSSIVDYSSGKTRIINSLGIDLAEKSSMFNSSLSCVIKDNEIVSHGDSLSSRKIPSFKEIESFSANVLDEARELKNPKKIKNIPENIIFEKSALAQLLDNCFLSNFNGLNILKNNSFLCGKEEEKLFSEKLNVLDSGLIENGLGSRSFDDEGTPSKETFLIENGVVKNFIYDYNTAKHMNKISTGNSSGRGIGFNNILIKSGKGINLDNAIIIKDIVGAHTSNPITTEFSVNSHGTFVIEKGVKKPVKDLMITGKMSEVLKNIIELDKKLNNIGNFYIPNIAFRGLKVLRI